MFNCTGRCSADLDHPAQIRGLLQPGSAGEIQHNQSIVTILGRHLLEIICAVTLCQSVKLGNNLIEYYPYVLKRPRIATLSQTFPFNYSTLLRSLALSQI